jgi:asparagine synthase (glutamine-hydrolysing)
VTRYEALFPEPDQASDFLNHCMAVDLQTVLPNDYLKKADRMSMAHSLELRVPLLDHHLVEYALSLPGRFKVTEWQTKKLLRTAMAGRVPAATVCGRKRGFSLPLSRWLREEWKVLLQDSLSRDAVVSAGLFHWPVIDGMLKAHLSGMRDYGKELWALLSLEIWRRHTVPSPRS